MIMIANLIKKISDILGVDVEKFTEASSSANTDTIPGVMRIKRGLFRYELTDNRISGLNLTQAKLTDEQWDRILALPELDVERLRALNLSENQLTRFPTTNPMSSLTWLDLSDNKINEFSLSSEMDRLIDLRLEGNPLTSPPPEILKQGSAAVLRFLRESQARGVEDVYEVKMLIVGEGGTGKTTLWHLLQNPNHPVPDPKQLSTVGIGIKEGWEFEHLQHPNTSFRVNLWDFGGQEIQYMTHQFFLTRRSLYVLLADGRREVANFPYWLKIIHLLGTEPEMSRPLPVLVVLNEKSNPISRLPYDTESVKTDFPRLAITQQHVDFGRPEDIRFQGLRTVIQQTLCQELTHLPLKIPISWDKVRRDLKDLRNHRKHINSSEFQDICNRNGVDDPSSRDDLSQMLHDLGVILHFHDDPALADFIVLNPQWAVNAVYEVLRHDEVVKNCGRFHRRVLRKIWTGRRYTDEEQGKMLSLMLKNNFEVCFQTTEQGEEIFIAPQLLPEHRPQRLDWQEEKISVRYIYQYPFMPKGIMGRLIVRLNEDIETREGRKVVWEKGAILKSNGCRTRIMETEDPSDGRKLIKIAIQGNMLEECKMVLRDIRQELDRIHQRSFPSLKVFQKVPCCCSECSTSLDPGEFDLKALDDMQAKNIPTAQCTKSHAMVPVQGLRRGVFPANDRMIHDVARPKRIYFSYAWGDRRESGESRETIVDKLYESLLNDGFDVRRDKMDIGYGGLISQFMEELGAGDLIVVFVSEKYLQSVYCMWEMCEIFRNSRSDKGEFSSRILPVRIGDLLLNKPKTMRGYLTYWRDFHQEYADLVRDFPQQVGRPQLEEFNKSRNIKDQFGEVIGYYQDLNAKTNVILQQNDFAEVKKVILARINQWIRK